MRKELRDLLLELISSVSEGIQYAAGAKREVAAPVISDCNDSIYAICDTLRNNLSSQRFLEYETVFTQMKESFENIRQEKESFDQGFFPKKIQKQLTKLHGKLFSEPEVKLEIVFLPYKASMWDSFDSVWRAATNDRRCDVYVVPIPYYNRDPGGSLKNSCYEGSELPHYVPVVPYEEYDLAARRPDIIYIHNPFDENNIVTSVYPRYYSGELKKHTGMLVYIPYFVTGALSSKLFHTLASSQHADLFIVQSKNDRKEYLRCVTSGDVVALGSPKVDYILRFKKEKPVMPKSWEDMLSGKKLFLLNTSITSLLNAKSLIAKIRHIFSCFRDRDDIALIWRPHPLSKPTLESMRLALLEEYNALEREFISLNLGVIDTTPHAGLAISLSDAYIGESTSSIVYMYAITGKPIFVLDYNLQSIRPVNEEDMRSVYFQGGYIKDGEMWFVANNMNGLFRMDINTGKARLVAELPGEDERNAPPLALTVWKHGDKLIIPTYRSQKIYEYDILSDHFKSIRIKEEDFSPSIFTKVYSYKGGLFIIPDKSRYIIRYDLDSGRYDYFDWLSKTDLRIKDDKSLFFAQYFCVRDNCLLMGYVQDNVVVEFNMDTGDAKLHTVGNPGNTYWSMVYDGKRYWLTQNRAPVPPAPGMTSDHTIPLPPLVRWDYETGEAIEYGDYPAGFEATKICFHAVVYCGGFIYAFPCYSNMILKINPETGEMKEFKTNFDFSVTDRKSDVYHPLFHFSYAAAIDDHTIIAMMIYDFSLIKIDVSTGDVTKLKIYVENSDYIDKYYPLEAYIRDYKYYEHTYFPLPRFIDMVSGGFIQDNQNQAQRYKGMVSNGDGSCGAKVHEYVKRQVLS